MVQCPRGGGGEGLEVKFYDIYIYLFTFLILSPHDMMTTCIWFTVFIPQPGGMHASQGTFYAPNFENVGEYIVRLYVFPSVRLSYYLETSCMDPSW